MDKTCTSFTTLNKLDIVSNKSKKRIPLAIGLEITSRCNNSCSHCYICTKQNDKRIQTQEISLESIKHLIDEAVNMGVLWCSITGGEPLLRNDFIDIYLYIKKKGFLVSVLTNATLVTTEHIKLFKTYPPRQLEVSIYGITEQTYEKITRVKGSFKKFCKGISLILDSNIPLIFKIIEMRDNKHEIDKIIAFCTNFKNTAMQFSKEVYAGINKNDQILLQRTRNKNLTTNNTYCIDTYNFSYENRFGGNLFLCNAGMNSFWIDYTGNAYICSLMRHPAFTYNLNKNSIYSYWHKIVPEILALRSEDTVFRKACGSCKYRPICGWCPAKAYLETGYLHIPVDYYCSK